MFSEFSLLHVLLILLRFHSALYYPPFDFPTNDIEKRREKNSVLAIKLNRVVSTVYQRVS